MKTEIPGELRALIIDLRQHPLFPELLKLMQPVARVPRYTPAKHEHAEEAHANWIFRSGQWSHYDLVRRLLAGEKESPRGDELTE